MKNTFLLTTLFFFLCQLPVVDAQKKVLGYPNAYKAPLNPYEDASIDVFTNERTWKDKDKDRGWWVVVDRSKVTAHVKPDENSSLNMTLNFAKPYFVTEVEEGWLYLVDAVVDETEIKTLKKKVGWVKAESLLLWNESLVNPRTKIHLKALLLNKFENLESIPCEKKEIVRVFLNPSNSDLRDTVNIYRFYFVYKIEGNRYLLGETPSMGRFDTSDRLLGWVDRERLAEWNTRVALEPNFSESGYHERKGNVGVQITGFEDQFATQKYSEEGQIEREYVTWKRDPVNAERGDLAASDPKRFRGDFMRFPLLSIGAQTLSNENLPYYRSAVCDEVLLKLKCKDGVIVDLKPIPIGIAGDVSLFLEKYQKLADNFNVFFVVEANSGMEEYKEAVAGLVVEIESTIKSRNLKAKIRFGALTYKDIAESTSVDALVKYRELSPDKSSFQRFIRNADFSNPNSNGNYPVQNYGISKALQIANFSPYHTNIMVVIGKKGDYSYDRLIGMKHKGSQANVDIGNLTDAINAGSVNMIGVQCIGGKLEGDKAFARNLRGIMLEAARKNYNKKFVNMNSKVQGILDNIGYRPASPEMDDPDEVIETQLALKNGTLQGNVFRIQSADKALSVSKLLEIVNAQTTGITQGSIELSNELERWKLGTIGASNAGFTNVLLEKLVKLYEEVELNVDWSEEKFELYKEVYFARKSKLATHPSFSYVLFWPEDDLRRYFYFIQRTFADLSNGSAMDKRIGLKDAYCALLEEFTGGEQDKKCEDYSIDEIAQIIQGVHREGVSFGFSGKKIGCILDPKCTTDAEIEDMIQNFVNVKAKLEDLVQGSTNEFIFKRGGESFFWIKVEDVY